MDTIKISKYEAIAFTVTAISSHILVNLPKSILSLAGSSSWITTIYISIITFFLILFAVKVFTLFENKDIIDISNFLGGKILKIICGISYLIFFLGSFIIAVKYFSESIRLIYFENSMSIFIILLFIIASIIANKLNAKVIFRACLLVVVVILISVILNVIFMSDNFIFDRLFPILGYSASNTFINGATTIFAFAGLSQLFFILPFLEKKKDLKVVAVLSMIISGIILFLNIVVLLLSISFVASSEELITSFLLNRLIEYGSFFQRAESIIIFYWFFTMFSYLSSLMFLSLLIFKKICNTKHLDGMVYCFASLVLVGTFSIGNIADAKFIEKYLYKYYSLSIVFIFTFIILFFSYLKKKKIDKRRRINA